MARFAAQCWTKFIYLQWNDLNPFCVDELYLAACKLTVYMVE